MPGVSPSRWARLCCDSPDCCAACVVSSKVGKEAQIALEVWFCDTSVREE